MNIDDIEDTIAKFQRKREEQATKTKEDFVTLCQVLRDRCVSHIAVRYSGCDDSGQIDFVDIHGDEGNEEIEDFVIEHPPIKVYKWPGGEVGVTKGLVSDLFTEWAYDVLEHLHAGWEINDGADGTVYFDVVDEKIRVEHNSYYTESDYSEDVL